MSTIGSITVDLSLASAAFSKGLQRAQSQITSFASNAKKIATAIGITAIGAAAVTAGYKVAGWVSEQMDAVDALNDQAQVLGVTIDQLARLGYAAKMSGADQETLGGALEKMNNNLSEAAAGSGPAAKSLAQIGLSAKALADQAPDQAFIQIAEALSQVENQGDRARLAQDLFGKSGQKLIPLLNEGAAGLRKLAAESDRIGNTVSPIDAAKIARANDALDRMQMWWDGIWRALAVQVAPILEEVYNSLVNCGIAGEGAASKIVAGFTAVAKVIEKAAGILEGFNSAQHTARALGMMLTGDPRADAEMDLANKAARRAKNLYDGKVLDDLLKRANQAVPPPPRGRAMGDTDIAADLKPFLKAMEMRLAPTSQRFSYGFSGRSAANDAVTIAKEQLKTQKQIKDGINKLGKKEAEVGI